MTASGRGDGRMSFAMNSTESNAVRNAAVNQAKQTIENRINAYGVAEPNITVGEGYRIVGQLPGLLSGGRVSPPLPRARWSPARPLCQ